MTNSNRRAPDRPMMLNADQIDAVIQRQREDATKWVLPGLIAATVIGVLVGMAIVHWWPK